MGRVSIRRKWNINFFRGTTEKKVWEINAKKSKQAVPYNDSTRILMIN
jgi:hypothetical protein